MLHEFSQPQSDPFQFLLSRVDYERFHAMHDYAQALRLERMNQLLERIGSPHLRLPAVHIAGTKGKGSVAAMIAAMLTEAGYRTGLYTSPHLERLEERIRLDGRCCSRSEMSALIDQLRPAIEQLDALAAADNAVGPTFFEILTAMAMRYFVDRQSQIAVLEVGLGGRLDATNVCRPVLCVITSISFDHTQQLGNTLAAIAGEKAGIIKPGVPVVSGVVEDEPREVIRGVCRNMGCPLLELGVDFDFRYWPARHLEQSDQAARIDFFSPPGVAVAGLQGLRMPMLGFHQAVNAAVALAAILQLSRQGWQTSPEAIGRAFGRLHWPGRIELLARRPAVILDSAHNVASVEALTHTIAESFSAARRVLVFGTTQDKDIAGMLACLLRFFDEVVFTQYSNNPRAVPAEQLRAAAQAITGRQYPVYPRPEQAWHFARSAAGPDDLICITGSFYLAGQMRAIIGGRLIQNENCCR